MYVIEKYRYGAYLESLLKNKTIVEFEQINSNIVKDNEKEIWSISKVEDFIKIIGLSI